MLQAAGPESLTWLGHSSFLLRTGGVTVLTDPFLSDRASPLATAGPKRFVPPGLPLAELPRSTSWFSRTTTTTTSTPARSTRCPARGTS